MIYEEIIKEVENGAKFTVNFQKRTCKVNRKVIVNDMQYEGFLGTYPSILFGWLKTCSTIDPWYDKIYKGLCKFFPNGIEGLEIYDIKKILGKTAT